MGIERRNNNVYYYRTTRCGSVVKRAYVGCGPFALAAAQLDADSREWERGAERARRAREAELKAQTAEFARWMASADGAVAVAMRAAGWHRVRRQWRKRRENGMTTAVATVENVEGLSWLTDTLWRQAPAMGRDELAKAQKGDPAALRKVDSFLAHPAGRALCGDAGRRALEKWVKLYSQKNPVLERGVLAFAADLRAKLAGVNATGLDVLLAERVVATWLFTAFAEDQLARVHDLDLNPDITPKQYAIFLHRVEMGNRWLMAACRTLAKVRRSKLPDILALVNMQPPDGKAALRTIAVKEPLA